MAELELELELELVPYPVKSNKHVPYEEYEGGFRAGYLVGRTLEELKQAIQAPLVVCGVEYFRAYTYSGSGRRWWFSYKTDHLPHLLPRLSGTSDGLTWEARDPQQSWAYEGNTADEVFNLWAGYRWERYSHLLALNLRDMALLKGFGSHQVVRSPDRDYLR